MIPNEIINRLIAEFAEVNHNLSEKSKLPNYPDSIAKEFEWLKTLCRYYCEASTDQQQLLRDTVRHSDVIFELNTLPQRLAKGTSITQQDLQIGLAALILVDQRTGIDYGFSLMKFCEAAKKQGLPLVETLHRAAEMASDERPSDLPRSTKQYLSYLANRHIG